MSGRRGTSSQVSFLSSALNSLFMALDHSGVDKAICGVLGIGTMVVVWRLKSCFGLVMPSMALVRMVWCRWVVGVGIVGCWVGEVGTVGFGAVDSGLMVDVGGMGRPVGLECEVGSVGPKEGGPGGLEDDVGGLEDGVDTVGPNGDGPVVLLLRGRGTELC